MNISSDQSELPTLAVFDFDGTLTRQDSLFPFLRMIVGQRQFWWKMLSFSPVLMGYALKLIPNWQAKEKLLTYFLAGLTKEELQQLGQHFASIYIPKLLRPEAVKCFQWHQKQGHKTILISASLEVYLLPWAKEMGFDLILGTQLEVYNDVITGRILGKNCYGTEKIKRLQELFENLSDYCVYAYGDHRSDKELLKIANYSFYRTFLATID
ncbi:HAD-IB family hydrolase [Aphanothece hegewaldii CCALA 016]|uniref:HAD-IB family hydrolase n=1 Tax=Aphanothece hegewaldii CCALA 016 TaxID=2107694 RepID=A0A2T1LZU4_9CHRO|nr:HAD family hydrolase [Aphanothece hegewaldii]PSF37907.1 HAD-IB family hydrolase [Aphanothece hegewaldii CCALA 016]